MNITPPIGAPKPAATPAATPPVTKSLFTIKKENKNKIRKKYPIYINKFREIYIYI